MIGIAAMAKIAELTDHPADANNYSSIAQSYIQQWETLGVASQADPAHTTLNYSSSASWGTFHEQFYIPLWRLIT
jgi:hypothetical protein